MPDITMCANGESCPKRMTCYRYRAVPTPGRQSFANFYEKDRRCAHYWKLEPGLRVWSEPAPEGDGA